MVIVVGDSVVRVVLVVVEVVSIVDGGGGSNLGTNAVMPLQVRFTKG